MKQITLRLIETDGEPNAQGLVGVTLAADILKMSKNTVRKNAKNGVIGYFWANKGERGEAMLLFRVDVIALKKKNEKKKFKCQKGQTNESK